MDAESLATLAGVASLKQPLEDRLQRGMLTSVALSRRAGAPQSTATPPGARSLSALYPSTPLPGAAAADDGLLTSLPPFRNLYLLTKNRICSHHIRVRFFNGAETMSYTYFGIDAASLRRSSCLACGPCCASHVVEMPEEVKMCIPTRVREQVVDAAVGLLHKEVPGALDVRATYMGYYAECSVTEIVCRTLSDSSNIRNELHQQLSNELTSLRAARTPEDTEPGNTSARTPREELEELDLKCMLSILDSSRSAEKLQLEAAAAAASKPTAIAGRRAGKAVHATGPKALPFADCMVHMATVTLFSDVDGNLLATHPSPAVLNGEEWEPEGLLPSLKATCTEQVASLSEVRLREKSAWIDFEPPSTGNLMLLRCTRGIRTDGHNLRQLVAKALETSSSNATPPCPVYAHPVGGWGLPPVLRERRPISIVVSRRGKGTTHLETMLTEIDLGSVVQAGKHDIPWSSSRFGIHGHLMVSCGAGNGGDVTSVFFDWHMLVHAPGSDAPIECVASSTAPIAIALATDDTTVVYSLAPTIVPEKLRVVCTGMEGTSPIDLQIRVAQSHHVF
jgi:hypothetical protein